MLAVILVGFLLASQATSGKRQFVPIEKRKVPHEVLMASCDDQLEECRERFLRVGEAWRGDINDDGRPELIIFPGTGGSGGEDASLFQRRGTKWVELLSWFPYVRRYDILPFTRQSYHDLCLADRYCFKWAGKSYVPYVPTDYRKLSTRWFNARRPDDAEMLWLIRYAGQRVIQFQPQWIDFSFDKHRTWVEAEDKENNIRWIGLFKDGVWGVRGNRAFLLLPRPDYKGSERIEFDGEWLIVYGEQLPRNEEQPVARYNRKTGELRIVTKETPYWLLEN